MPWLTRFDRRKSAILGTAPERDQLATLPGGQHQITHGTNSSSTVTTVYS